MVSVDFPASLADADVLRIAGEERRVLITNDRDFGELVMARGMDHAGIILFRLDPTASLAVKTERLDHVLTSYGEDLRRFLVVSNDRVRIRG